MSATDSAINTISATSTSRLEELGNQLKSIKASIADLEKTFKEASKEVSKSLKEASKNKRVKRVREGPYTPSAGQQAWNNYVATVRQELQKSNTSATYKDAMMEAKKRRAAGDVAAPPSTTSKKSTKVAKAAAPVAAVAAPVVAAAAAAAPAKAAKAPKAKVIKA